MRLPPQLKLGLEVYAADKNFSLSSAVEEAVTLLLSTAELSNGMTIPEVVSKVELEPRSRRLISLYLICQRFVSIEDRNLLDIIFSSKEMKAAEREPEPKISQRMKMEVVKFVMDHWTVITRSLGGTWWRVRDPVSLHKIVYPEAEEVAAEKKAEDEWIEDMLKRSAYPPASQPPPHGVQHKKPRTRRGFWFELGAINQTKASALTPNRSFNPRTWRMLISRLPLMISETML